MNWLAEGHAGPYITGVDIAITLVLLIALVVGIDTAARTVKPPPPSPPTAASTGKIIVDLDRRD